MSASFAGKRFGDPGGCPRARCPQPPEARHAPPARRRRRGRAGWARRARVARRLRERNKDHDPRPIPGGFDGNFNPVSSNPLIHVLPPSVGAEMSTITDFDGVIVGAAEMQGTAQRHRRRRAGGSTADMRFMKRRVRRPSTGTSAQRGLRLRLNRPLPGSPWGLVQQQRPASRLRARHRGFGPFLDDPDLELVRRCPAAQGDGSVQGTRARDPRLRQLLQRDLADARSATDPLEGELRGPLGGRRRRSGDRGRDLRVQGRVHHRRRVDLVQVPERALRRRVSLGREGPVECRLTGSGEEQNGVYF